MAQRRENTGPDATAGIGDRRLLAFLDVLPMPVTISQVPDGTIVYANPAQVGAMRAGSAAEVVGHNAAEFIAPEYAEAAEVFGEELAAGWPATRMSHLCLGGCHPAVIRGVSAQGGRD